MFTKWGPRIGIGIVAILLIAAGPLHSEPGSILAVRTVGQSRIQKANGNPGAYLSRLGMAIQGQEVEQIQYRGFTLLVHPINGQYEIEVTRMITYGNVHVSSLFSSIFKSSVEYSYTYDPSTQQIIQRHFIFPPNSLTGWANPDDYLTMARFGWNESFPSKNCSVPIFSLEESGREYLQAGCFANRDAALLFARKFIDYVLSARGM